MENVRRRTLHFQNDTKQNIGVYLAESFVSYDQSFSYRASY